MNLDGAFDQYLRVVAYNLNILLLLMLSANVNALRYVFRGMAVLLVVQQAMVWLLILHLGAQFIWVQTYALTAALWLLVILLGITILALPHVKK